MHVRMWTLPGRGSPGDASGYACSPVATRASTHHCPSHRLRGYPRGLCSCRSWVCPKASRLVPVLCLSSPTFHAGGGGFPAAAEVRDLPRANPNPLSHHLKYKSVNAHGADFDQWETDTEGYIFSSFLGTLFGDALASFNLSADVL